MHRNITDSHVCVVGGAGFLGSHLVNYLIEKKNCKVLVIDNLEVGKKEFIHSKATFEYADITESEDYLYRLFDKYCIQYVFNYAARPYIPDCFERPLRTMAVNAMGAIQVINAAQRAEVRAILQVSSAELYGGTNIGKLYEYSSGGYIRSFEKRNLDEYARVEPHSTYGAAKAAVDYYCQVAWRERDTPVIALRQFNCVGERETHPYIIPEIISQLSAWRNDTNLEERYKRIGLVSDIPTVKLGNNSYRDFLYAGDAVRVAVDLIENGNFGEVYNLGSEKGIQIYDLAQLIGKLMGYEQINVVEDKSRKRPWEIWHLESDNTKIKEAIDHDKISEINLESTLELTIKWYKENGCRWPWEK